MSGHGCPPLCKPEHVSRARELCARGVINPDLLEPASWARQQNDRRKGRKGRKPRILRKWGPFRRWREAAETGGNWRKPPAGTLLEKLSAVLLSQPRGALQALIGGSLAEIAEIPRAGPGLSHMATPVVSTKAPLDFARGRLAAWRDLSSTISRLSSREGPSTAPPFGRLRSGRRGHMR